MSVCVRACEWSSKPFAVHSASGHDSFFTEVFCSCIRLSDLVSYLCTKHSLHRLSAGNLAQPPPCFAHCFYHQHCVLHDF